ncbi:MAG: Asp-tRNA(Asn)/Glu-tRNA(Gln) amidotransferase subunit GatC [Myxococcales bacterium]
MIDRAEVRRVAALAHLALSEEEELRLAGELSQILAYVEKLRELPTEGVEPTTAVASRAAFREDIPLPSLPAERAVDNAPATVGTAFSVPKILE